MSGVTIPRGFERPVFDAQSTFRSLLAAMSRPAKPVRLHVLPEGPSTWPRSMTALVLTLCDMETPVWLDAAARSDEAVRFLRFHCGCPVTETPEDAAFAVVLDPAQLPDLGRFAMGSAEYPETSSTILLAASLGSVMGDQGVLVRGPGVSGVERLPASWLPEGFIPQWQNNAKHYPRGVDIVLVGTDAIAGLPRTLTPQEESCM